MIFTHNYFSASMLLGQEVTMARKKNREAIKFPKGKGVKFYKQWVSRERSDRYKAEDEYHTAKVELKEEQLRSDQRAQDLHNFRTLLEAILSASYNPGGLGRLLARLDETSMPSKKKR